jgi:catechol 2,3-dioxygenase-like lactoylglutathione lyase family enzyme
MEARLSFVTLGVRDLPRAAAFYQDVLGLPRISTPPEVAFFELGKTWLSLYPRDLLAADAGVDAAGSGFSGVTLAHNVRSAEDVDALLAHVERNGGRIVRRGARADWGGYTGYFADPDGFLWEVAWNPHFPHVEPPGLSGGQLVRSVTWQRLDRPGLEYGELRSVRRGWELAGAVVLPDGGVPAHVRYAVVCDAQWATREARVTLLRDGAVRELTLRVDSKGQWWRGDSAIPDVRGCVDVDLGFTPATNTLPIRRLALRVGEAREVTAAWVRFPDLEVLPLPQRYERLTETRYRYESRGGEFRAELETDELGLVAAYPPGWRRV